MKALEESLNSLLGIDHVTLYDKISCNVQSLEKKKRMNCCIDVS